MSSPIKDLLSRPTAVVIVDMQNDYCTPEGIIASLGGDVSRAAEVAAKVSHFVETARPSVKRTIFVRTELPTHLRSPALGSHYGRNPLGRRISSSMSEWYGVAPGANDIVVTKHRYSPFVDTCLPAILRAAEIHTIIVMGVTTEVCVESTVRDAFMRDLSVLVASDCTYGSTSEREANSLSVMDTFFARVLPSEQILGALTDGRQLFNAETRQS